MGPLLMSLFETLAWDVSTFSWRPICRRMGLWVSEVHGWKRSGLLSTKNLAQREFSSGRRKPDGTR